MGTCTVVVCPDSFKGSIDAFTAATAIAGGWSQRRTADRVLCYPQADGGEGTVAAIAAVLPGERRQTRVVGPDGRPVTAQWYLTRDGTAVCELAESSGLPLMARPDPLGATTYGLGQVIADALGLGARAILVGLGGSASTDGGAGALQALGFVLRDAAGMEVDLLGHRGLDEVVEVVGPDRGWPPITLLTDVTAPLLGPGGAAVVYGPQKGASPTQVGCLEARLAGWAGVLGGPDELPGMGAAGGVGFGLARALGAVVAPGAERISMITGLTAAAAGADVLITGEGSFDATSMTGKVTGHALGLVDTGQAVRCVVAGRLSSELLSGPGAPMPDLRAVSLTDLAGSAAAAMADPRPLLGRAGALLADSLDRLS